MAATTDKDKKSKPTPANTGHGADTVNGPGIGHVDFDLSSAAVSAVEGVNYRGVRPDTTGFIRMRLKGESGFSDVWCLAGTDTYRSIAELALSSEVSKSGDTADVGQLIL